MDVDMATNADIVALSEAPAEDSDAMLTALTIDAPVKTTEEPHNMP